MKYIRRWSRIGAKVRSRYQRAYRIIFVYYRSFALIRQRAFGRLSKYCANWWGGHKELALCSGKLKWFSRSIKLQGIKRWREGMLFVLMDQVFFRRWVTFMAEAFFQMWGLGGRFMFFKFNSTVGEKFIRNRFYCQTRTTVNWFE